MSNSKANRLLSSMDQVRTVSDRPPAEIPPALTSENAGSRGGGFVGNALGNSNASLDLKLKEQSELIDQLNKKNAQLEDAMSNKSYVVYLDPKVVRPSKYADRHACAFQDQAFDELCELIADSGGNTEAVKVRPIVDPEGKFEYELASGHRRHQATLRKSVPLKAEIIAGMTEIDLVKQMHRENSGREELSPYERGVQWARLIDEGIFSSGRQLAIEFGISKTAVVRLLRYSSLPQVVVRAFGDPRTIRREWCDLLIKSYEEDPKGMIARCESISPDDPPMKKYHHLANINNERSVIVDDKGVFARIRKVNGYPAIMLPRDTPKEMTDEIADVIKKFIEGKRSDI